MRKIDSAFERVSINSPVAMEELRCLAVPVARFLVTQGMLASEVRIDTLGVSVFSPDAGNPFTPEDESHIFQE